jgi:hypothetical protein
MEFFKITQMNKYLCILICLCGGCWSALLAQQKTEIHGQAYEVFNRTSSALDEAGKKGLRLSEASGNGLAWVEGLTFTEGVIEFDVRGRDELQKSFVGVAFHGQDEHTYECVYFRPFNFNVSDTARCAHAVQYIFEPKFPWDVLRKLRYNDFEKPIGIPNISKTDWLHAKVEVRKGRIKVYVNHNAKPALDVPTLNEGGKGVKIGFWVGTNANGDFANLQIKP